MKLIETAREIGILCGVRKFWIGFMAVAAVLFVGCKNDSSPGTAPERATRVEVAPAPATVAPASPGAVTPLEIPRATEGRPQARLVTLKLWVGTNEITAEIAQTMPQIMAGMMWRTNMAEMDGMLFVFAHPHRAQFWMRNTLLPLSCAYIDSEGTILELHDMKPRDETGIPAATDEVQYVLEMNQGWFERHNVTPGMLIATERGTFPKTFMRR